MPKPNIYICSNCDAQSPKWSGRCLECGAWGTLTEQTASPKKDSAKTVPAELISLENINTENQQRLITDISEFDRVLGGGIIPGSIILLSGEPGIGKSTLVAQVAGLIAAKNNSSIIYASGEESAGQVKGRFDRLDIPLKDIKFVSETAVEKITASIVKEKPALAIIDSIQTVCTADAPGEAGSLSQIRAAAAKFLEIAKQDNIPIILIGHITKDGSIAGPKSLEHIVDVVLYLESEDLHNFRILRSTKNRFGSVNEIGLFDMRREGFVEIKNPSAVFLDDTHSEVTGSVISCVLEGTRPFLVEVQALVTKTVFGYPQRKASGFDLNRLQVLIAVLTKRAKINLTNQDVILNIVGGLKINEPSLDLAVCLAIASSLLNQTVSRKTIVMGEVGLGGEIRNVAKIEQRLLEAEKLGFSQAIIPSGEIKAKKIKTVQMKELNELAKYLSK